jgi:hypothetical protein
MAVRGSRSRGKGKGVLFSPSKSNTVSIKIINIPETLVETLHLTYLQALIPTSKSTGSKLKLTAIFILIEDVCRALMLAPS